MVSVDAAVRLAESLPDVSPGKQYGNRTWFVAGKGFVWERPFRKADVKRFGDAPVPSGPIFAVRTADLHAKDAVLARQLRGVFTIPHFDGYAAVLVQLDVVTLRDLKRLVTDAWLACGPEAPTPPTARRPRKKSARDGVGIAAPGCSPPPRRARSSGP